LFDAQDNQAIAGATVVGLAVTTGLNASSPIGVISQWSVIMQVVGAGAPVYLHAFGVPLAGSFWLGSGQIISSAIDFTSASLKLFRQLVVTHVPVPTGGQFFIGVWMDQDVDNLNAVPDFVTTNSTVGTSATILLINKVARKLVYLLQYLTPINTLSAPRPKAVAIQAATGWIWKAGLALSNSARLNSQQPNTFCFQQQGLDAKTAYNFIRQLWRLKGGQCLATFEDGDQYNAVIESVDFTSPKPLSVTMSGDRKSHYEVLAAITIREDA